jgi:hypothetical protein
MDQYKAPPVALASALLQSIPKFQRREAANYREQSSSQRPNRRAIDHRKATSPCRLSNRSKEIENWRP